MPESAENGERADDRNEDENVMQRAAGAVDRSRNLRQIIALKRLLRELTGRPPDDDSASASR